MALDICFYIVPEHVAIRVGDLSRFYKTADGRYIMDSRTLKRINLTKADNVEHISRNEALTLIAKGGYKTDSNELNDKE